MLLRERSVQQPAAASYLRFTRSIFILRRLLLPRYIDLSLGLVSIFSTDGGIVAIRMLKKIVAITTIVSVCLVAILLNVTIPTSVGPLGILTVFIFAYLSSLGVMTYFLYATIGVTAHLSAAFTVKRPFPALSFKRAYYFSTVLAAAPIMLIGLQSVGSIGIYEFLLVIIFTVIGCLYISKRIQ